MPDSKPRVQLQAIYITPKASDSKTWVQLYTPQQEEERRKRGSQR
jgi:hypothetical protein